MQIDANNFCVDTEWGLDYLRKRGIGQLVVRINNSFFGGSVFAPKSFSDLCINTLYFELPHTQVLPPAPANAASSIEFADRMSFIDILGYIENLPLIGSAIAAINLIGHLFFMQNAYVALSSLANVDINQINPNDKLQHYVEVANTALSYTMHFNAAFASALAIIPLAKPAIRLLQILMDRSHQPINGANYQQP